MLAPIIPPPTITTWALSGIPCDIGENDRLDVLPKQFWLLLKLIFIILLISPSTQLIRSVDSYWTKVNQWLKEKNLMIPVQLGLPGQV